MQDRGYVRAAVATVKVRRCWLDQGRLLAWVSRIALQYSWCKTWARVRTRRLAQWAAGFALWNNQLWDNRLLEWASLSEGDG